MSADPLADAAQLLSAKLTGGDTGALEGTSVDTSLQYEVVQAYDKFAPAIYRYAMAICKSEDLTQDTVQECFFRYFVFRNEGGEIQNHRAWLFRVARNYILDRRKQSSSREEMYLEDLPELVDSIANPERAYEGQEATRNIPNLLAPRELECLELRAAGFRYEEIATVLNIRSGTVGATLARAVRKVRDSFHRVSRGTP